MKSFRRCKLCGEDPATPGYLLPETVIYTCPRCDLHFIDLHDDLSPATRENFGAALDEKGRRYIEERLPGTAALLDLRFDLLRRHLDLAHCRCLDIGAGSGQFLARLAESGAEGHGIEPSLLRRQFAMERFALHLRPEPVENPFWQENFMGYFSAITLWEVIEHVNDPLATIRGACRLLAPTGLLFLETHSRLVPAYRLSEWCYRLTRGKISLFLGNFFPPIPFGHKQLFTPDQLTSLTEKNGFEVVFRDHAFPGAAHTPFKVRDKIVVVARKRAAATQEM